MNCLYHFGPYVLDPRRRTLSRSGLPVSLTPKAFDLLVFFAQNPNRVITKDELLKAVWADSFVEEGNLTQNVFLLRKMLGQQSEDSGLILIFDRGVLLLLRILKRPRNSSLQALLPVPQRRIAV